METGESEIELLSEELPIIGRKVVAISGETDDVTLHFDDGSTLNFMSSQTHGWKYTPEWRVRK